MDKIIINNQEINIVSASHIENGLVLTTKELNLVGAELLFPAKELINFEIANSDNVIYGIYANLKVYALSKKIMELEDGATEEIIEIRLGIANNTTQRLGTVEETVDMLVMSQLGL